MVRLSDYQHRSVDESRVKSRAYLSVGALAVAAGIAFLAVPDTVGEAGSLFRDWVTAGAILALILFAASAVFAVVAERATRLPDAPDPEEFAQFVVDEDAAWTEDQLALWVAFEYIDTVIPAAEKTVDKIARLVQWQLVFFLFEVGALGATLIIALVAGYDGEVETPLSKCEAAALRVAECLLAVPPV